MGPLCGLSLCTRRRLPVCLLLASLPRGEAGRMGDDDDTVFDGVAADGFGCGWPIGPSDTNDGAT